MKLYSALFLFAFLVLTACKHKDNSKTIEAADPSIARVEVIDFYGTHRCKTCKAIEANAKYTVDIYFQDAVKAGKLVFKTVNVDEEANYDMAERFEAVGTALFLNVIKDGREHHIDLTNFGFEKGNDKAAFSQELKEKIAEQLNTL